MLSRAATLLKESATSIESLEDTMESFIPAYTDMAGKPLPANTINVLVIRSISSVFVLKSVIKDYNPDKDTTFPSHKQRLNVPKCNF